MLPGHVRELPADAGLPEGFRAAGVAAGLKPSGDPDIGLLVCDAEQPASAAVFTSSSTAAAPVLVTRERCRLGRCGRCWPTRAAPTPPPARAGSTTPPRRRAPPPPAAGVSEAEVALASTGAISHYLPVDAVLKGILQARSQLRREGDVEFQRAIQTTDRFEKRANLEVELSVAAACACAPSARARA